MLLGAWHAWNQEQPTELSDENHSGTHGGRGVCYPEAREMQTEDLQSEALAYDLKDYDSLIPVIE